MSCDTQRKRWFAKLSQNPTIQAALGVSSAADAAQALAAAYDAGKNRLEPSTTQQRARDLQAEVTWNRVVAAGYQAGIALYPHASKRGIPGQQTLRGFQAVVDRLGNGFPGATSDAVAPVAAANGPGLAGALGPHEAAVLATANGTETDVSALREVARTVAGRAGLPMELRRQALAYMRETSIHGTATPDEQQAQGRDLALAIARQIPAEHCPHCGQFVGQAAHTCRVQAFLEAHGETLRRIAGGEPTRSAGISRALVETTRAVLNSPNPPASFEHLRDDLEPLRKSTRRVNLPAAMERQVAAALLRTAPARPEAPEPDPDDPAPTPAQLLDELGIEDRSARNLSRQTVEAFARRGGDLASLRDRTLALLNAPLVTEVAGERRLLRALQYAMYWNDETDIRESALGRRSEDSPAIVAMAQSLMRGADTGVSAPPDTTEPTKGEHP